MMQAYYQKPTRWQGRADAEQARFFQTVTNYDLSAAQALSTSPAFMLLGFCCDQGVTHNQGRPGSAEGPTHFRQQFANLALQKPLSWCDAGNIICPNEDLASAQQALADAVSLTFTQDCLTCVIGGGHETAWGHYLGLAPHADANLGIINIDAHFDLRQPQAGIASSGTPFYQIAEARHEQGLPFSYYCLGIQPQANTHDLFTRADELNVHYSLAESLLLNPEPEMQKLQAFIDAREQIYLSICLDAFSQSIAPGVSAPQSFGLMPAQVLPLLRMILASDKVISCDIVELAPCYDRDNMTAKLAANLLSFIIHM